MAKLKFNLGLLKRVKRSEQNCTATLRHVEIHEALILKISDFMSCQKLLL